MAGNYGWIDLPEFPYCIEPRWITRIEAMKYARQGAIHKPRGQQSFSKIVFRLKMVKKRQKCFQF